MKYIEATIYTSSEGIEFVSTMLGDFGIFGVVIENPQDVDDLMDKKKSYDWDYVDSSVLALKDKEPSVTFYLEGNKENVALLEEIRIQSMMLKGREYEGNLPEGFTFGRMYIEDRWVDDEDWKDNWKEYFKVARVTQRLVIKPSWEEYTREDPEDLIIEIDPGMAFGTGTHATTSLCLTLAEKYLKPGDQILDVGCGSGILSIGAALLGAENVLGIEIDPIAVAIARENVDLNGLSQKVQVLEGDLTKGLEFQGDLIVANLMADLVITLSNDVAKHLKEGGIFISSGILIEKKKQVVEHMEACGFTILEILEKDEWCAIAAKK